ncbi:unnamed protein product [Vitrella brassicaformis CCMP3155]|uniref:Uncharacterized protein n=4 Tax=Vitrella brassicaformis TaxID=1169539 RepID=A0A0G4GHJ0_VITBC|nr:unnamed protein product [Vitrella brassicaformis CCMP3155]|eukprot:CEM29206.1 unnamed protein product [Vitrella brassicaformis CCMP3155]
MGCGGTKYGVEVPPSQVIRGSGIPFQSLAWRLLQTCDGGPWDATIASEVVDLICASQPPGMDANGRPFEAAEVERMGADALAYMGKKMGPADGCGGVVDALDVIVHATLVYFRRRLEKQPHASTDFIDALFDKNSGLLALLSDRLKSERGLIKHKGVEFLWGLCDSSQLPNDVRSSLRDQLSVHGSRPASALPFQEDLKPSVWLGLVQKLGGDSSLYHRGIYPLTPDGVSIASCLLRTAIVGGTSALDDRGLLPPPLISPSLRPFLTMVAQQKEAHFNGGLRAVIDVWMSNFGGRIVAATLSRLAADDATPKQQPGALQSPYRENEAIKVAHRFFDAIISSVQELRQQATQRGSVAAAGAATGGVVWNAGLSGGGLCALGLICEALREEDGRRLIKGQQPLFGNLYAASLPAGMTMPRPSVSSSRRKSRKGRSSFEEDESNPMLYDDEDESDEEGLERSFATMSGGGDLMVYGADTKDDAVQTLREYGRCGSFLLLELLTFGLQNPKKFSLELARRPPESALRVWISHALPLTLDLICLGRFRSDSESRPTMYPGGDKLRQREKKNIKPEGLRDKLDALRWRLTEVCDTLVDCAHDSDLQSNLKDLLTASPHLRSSDAALVRQVATRWNVKLEPVPRQSVAPSQPPKPSVPAAEEEVVQIPEEETKEEEDEEEKEEEPPKEVPRGDGYRRGDTFDNPAAPPNISDSYTKQTAYHLLPPDHPVVQPPPESAQQQEATQVPPQTREKETGSTRDKKTGAKEVEPAVEQIVTFSPLSPNPAKAKLPDIPAHAPAIPEKTLEEPMSDPTPRVNFANTHSPSAQLLAPPAPVVTRPAARGDATPEPLPGARTMAMVSRVTTVNTSIKSPNESMSSGETVPAGRREEQELTPPEQVLPVAEKEEKGMFRKMWDRATQGVARPKHKASPERTTGQNGRERETGDLVLVEALGEGEQTQRVRIPASGGAVSPSVQISIGPINGVSYGPATATAAPHTAAIKPLHETSQRQEPFSPTFSSPDDTPAVGQDEHMATMSTLNQSAPEFHSVHRLGADVYTRTYGHGQTYGGQPSSQAIERLTAEVMALRSETAELRAAQHMLNHQLKTMRVDWAGEKMQMQEQTQMTDQGTLTTQQALALPPPPTSTQTYRPQHIVSQTALQPSPLIYSPSTSPAVLSEIPLAPRFVSYVRHHRRELPYNVRRYDYYPPALYSGYRSTWERQREATERKRELQKLDEEGVRHQMTDRRIREAREAVDRILIRQ